MLWIYCIYLCFEQILDFCFEKLEIYAKVLRFNSQALRNLFADIFHSQDISIYMYYITPYLYLLRGFCFLK